MALRLGGTMGTGLAIAAFLSAATALGAEGAPAKELQSAEIVSVRAAQLDSAEEGDVVAVVLGRSPYEETMPVPVPTMEATQRAFSLSKEQEPAATGPRRPEMGPGEEFLGHGSGPSRSRVGAVAVRQLQGKVNISCPRRVDAGQPIEVKVKSEGDCDVEWRVFIVYPEGARYEGRGLKAGKKVMGSEKAEALSFPTYPADGGRLLGVRIDDAAFPLTGRTFWVEVR